LHKYRIIASSKPKITGLGRLFPAHYRKIAEKYLENLQINLELH